MRKIGVTVKERKSRGPNNWGMSEKMDLSATQATLYKELGLNLWVARLKITVELVNTRLSPSISNLMLIYRARQVFTNRHLNSNINRVLPTATNNTLAFLKSTSVTHLLANSDRIHTLINSSKKIKLHPSTKGTHLLNNKPTRVVATIQTWLQIWRTTQLTSLMMGDKLIHRIMVASKYMDKLPPRLKIITTLLQ